jgi:soluble lytic murein transglycosylase-like protein
VQLKKLTALLCLCVVCVSTPARAETAFFDNGNSISVKSHRIEGDSVVLMLRDGGEMVSSSSSIVKFGPDDPTYVQPTAAAPAPAPVPTPLLVSMPLPAPAPTSTYVAPYDELIDKLSAMYAVPSNLVHAVIEVESGYDERAVSRTGAKGLMQLMPDTARRFNVDNPFDARQNIEGGVRYLRQLLDQFPLKLAVAAYNAGENAVRRFRGIPPYAETRGYVARVLRLAGK